MRQLVTSALSFALVVLLSVALIGCDDDPTSVEDFDIQPALELSQGSVTFIAGQSPPPQVSVSYQGLTEAPTMQSNLQNLTVELVEEQGSPENGSRTWTMTYDGFPETDFVEGTVLITASGEGRAIERNLNVQVNNPVSITTDFAPTFLLVEDYERGFQDGPENGAGILPEVNASGGTTAEVQSDEVSANSNGPSALAVTAASGDPVTLVREANAPGLDVLSFLIKPDPSSDFQLTVSLDEEVDGETVTREVDVPVESGTEWIQYNLAVGALFEDFDPVASRAGGSGPLQSVSFTTDQDVTYHLDEVMMGTAQGPELEINDFQATSFAYGEFANIQFGTSSNVAAEAVGPTAREMTWSEGGNFFGYNWNSGRVAEAGSASIVVRVGAVSRTFNLYVFVETPDGAGGYNFDAGTSVSVPAGDGWGEVSVPLSQLGDNPSALADPGIQNIGFEIRRSDGDGTTEPISFLIDDIRLKQDN